MHDVPDYIPPTVTERVRKTRATRRAKEARLRTPEAEAAMRHLLVTGTGSWTAIAKQFGVSIGYLRGLRNRVQQQLWAEAEAAAAIDHTFTSADRAALIVGGFTA